MRKRGILSFGMFFLFIFIISIVPLSLAQVPDIGESSCQTYAQARAKGVQGTDAELRRMGFCPGDGEETTTATTQENVVTVQKTTSNLESARDAARKADEAAWNRFHEASKNLDEILMNSENEKAWNEFDKEGTAFIDEVILGQAHQTEEKKRDKINEEFLACNKGCPLSTDNPNVQAWKACLDACSYNSWQKTMQAEIEYFQTAIAMVDAKTEQYNQKIKELGGTASGNKEKQLTPQESKSGSSSEEYAHMQAELILQLSKELEFYYNHLVDPASITMSETRKKLAQAHFDDSLPLQTEIGRARFAYENAQKKGVSKEELAKMKAEYEQKIPVLKEKLQRYVLTEDKSNTDALWVLSTVTKWEGNNKESYEYTRDALMYEKAINPIKYQQHMDTLRDPGVRMLLLQHFEPYEKIINLPTVETSPALRYFKDTLDKTTEKVDEKKRQIAREVEQFSRGYSLSNFLPKKFRELGGLSVEENE